MSSWLPNFATLRTYNSPLRQSPQLFSFLFGLLVAFHRSVLYVKQNRGGDGLAVILPVYQEECLLRRFVGGFDRQSISVVTDYRTVTNELTSVKEGVIVTRAVKVCVTHLFPLGDCLVHRDGKTPNTTVVADKVSVVERHDEVVALVVEQVCLRDEELDTLVFHEVACEELVGDVFQRVACLFRDVQIFGKPAVVTHHADDINVDISVFEQVADATSDFIDDCTDSFSGGQFVQFHERVVDVVGDKVAQNRQTQRVDFRVGLLFLDELGYSVKELLQSLPSNCGIVFVESQNGFLLHSFLKVNVGKQCKCGRFGQFACRRKGDGGWLNLQRTLELKLSLQDFNLFKQKSVLFVGTLHLLLLSLGSYKVLDFFFHVKELFNILYTKKYTAPVDISNKKHTRRCNFCLDSSH